jgi:hypothetical protein
MVVYTRYDVTYTTGAVASDWFYDVADEQSFVYTRDIFLQLDGRTIDTIVVSHIANPDDLNNIGHLDGVTTAMITATHR